MFKQKLQEIVNSLLASMDDAEKCELGNVSAGRRVRKSCMDATKELKELRSIILEHSKK